MFLGHGFLLHGVSGWNGHHVVSFGSYVIQEGTKLKDAEAFAYVVSLEIAIELAESNSRKREDWEEEGCQSKMGDVDCRDPGKWGLGFQNAVIEDE